MPYVPAPVIEKLYASRKSMTKDEFYTLTKGSIQEAIDKASIIIGKTVPNETVSIVSSTSVLAHGWEESCNYLVSQMYFGEDKIKPCADLIVYEFDDNTTFIKLFIASYEPAPFDLNWSNGVGPYIKGVSQKLLSGKGG